MPNACQRSVSLNAPVRTSFAIAILLLFSLSVVPCHAKPEFLATARTTYSFKPGGTIDRASCALCHVQAPTLNPYGSDVKSALHAAGVTSVSAAILQSIESKDSDGDGFSNGDEFKADTLPGDPKSHPTGKPTLVTRTVAAEAVSQVNPFDLKTALLAKHAQHPVLVHFPIALFIISLFFDLLGFRTGNTALRKAAYYNLVTAAVTSIVAIVTGLIAWQWQWGGAALTGNLLKHLVFALVTTVCIWTLWWMRIRMDKQDSPGLRRAYLIVGLIGFGLISLTGHIGGILSGVVTN